MGGLLAGAKTVAGKVLGWLLKKPNMNNPAVKAAAEKAATESTRVWSRGRIAATTAGGLAVGSAAAGSVKEGIDAVTGGEEDKGLLEGIKDFVKDKMGIGSLVGAVLATVIGLVVAPAMPVVGLLMGVAGLFAGQPVMQGILKDPKPTEDKKEDKKEDSALKGTENITVIRHTVRGVRVKGEDQKDTTKAKDTTEATERRANEENLGTLPAPQTPAKEEKKTAVTPAPATSVPTGATR